MDSKVHAQIEKKKVTKPDGPALFSIKHGRPQTAVVSQRCSSDTSLLGTSPLPPPAYILHYCIPIHYSDFVDLTQTFDS